MKFDRVKTIRNAGRRRCYDISLSGKEKGFFANDILVHNSDFSVEDAFKTFEDGIKFQKKYPDEAQLAMDLEGQVRGCLSGNTHVIFPNGKDVEILELYDKKYRGRLKAYDIDETEAIFDDVEDIYYSGRKDTFRICLKDERTIVATADHLLLTKLGWKKVSDLKIGKDFVAIDETLQRNISWMGWRRVADIIPNGVIDTYDIVMKGKHHNFVANGIVTHNSGQHAAAICISNESLYNGKRCNLCVRNGSIVANWDKYDAEYMGMMKLDVLGLSTLTVLNQTRAMVKRNHGVEIDFNELPLDDKKVYEMISKGHTVGLFQIGSMGLSSYCKELGVENFDMLVHATSLWRPGTLRSGLVSEFAERKKGKPYKGVHPLVDKLTKDTYGIILYQEQVMLFMYELGGLGWKTCDTVRKVISKSQGEELFMRFREMFAQGCVDKGTLDRATAEKLWEELASFGCLTGDTVIYSIYANKELTIEQAYRYQKKSIPKYRGMTVLSMDSNEFVGCNQIKRIVKTGRKRVFEIKTKNGKIIKASINHRFLFNNKWSQVSSAKVGDTVKVTDFVSSVKGCTTYDDEVVSIKSMGIKETYDIEMVGEPRNFIANGFVSHNSYGFNKCLSGDTFVTVPSGKTTKRIKLEQAYLKKPDKILIYDSQTQKSRFANTKEIVKCGQKKTYKLTCYDRNKQLFYHIKTSIDHKFMTESGWKRMKELKIGDKVLIKDSLNQSFEFIPIKAVRFVAIEETYDIHVDDEEHNYIANMFVVHNSHAVEYSILTYWEAYLKIHHPAEFMACSLTYGSEDKKIELVGEARRLGLEIKLPEMGKSHSTNWETYSKSGILYAPFVEIKGVGEKTVENILNMQVDNKGFFKKKESKLKAPGKKVIALLEKLHRFNETDEATDEATDEIQELFQFSVRSDSMYKVKGIYELVKDKISLIQNINFTKADAECKLFFGILPEIKYGYRQSVLKSASSPQANRHHMQGTADSLGGVYGFMKDLSETANAMVVFNSKLYNQKKEIIEHCAGKWCIMKANHPRRATNNLFCEEIVLEDDLFNCEFGGLVNGLLKKPACDSLPDIKDCQECSLRAEATAPVAVSLGNNNVLILGEAPGMTENRQGKGFIGKAGEVLWKELALHKFGREDFCLGNVTKCFPSITRTPTKRHINTCTKKWLDKEIALIQPKLVLALGNVPLQYFKEQDSGISQLNGTTEWNAKYKTWICWCVHPASVLYQSGDKEAFAKGISNFVRCLKNLK